MKWLSQYSNEDERFVFGGQFLISDIIIGAKIDEK